jgi:hypothetical protein
MRRRFNIDVLEHPLVGMASHYPPALSVPAVVGNHLEGTS